jgi:hypothetical protein
MADRPDSSPLNLKGKGDLAELMVAADLRRRGFKIAIPFGEDCDFDLVLIRDDRLERVQVKYAESDGSVVKVKCFSHSLTNGKCFYIPARDLGETGRSTMHLRLKPALNKQYLGTRPAGYLAP